MLDNKNLSQFAEDTLRGLSYGERIDIYDKNCAGCPFNLIRVIKNKRIIEECHNIYDAIETCLDFEGSRIVRLCNYGGEEYKIEEIMANTCRLWNKLEYDEGIFEEVEDSDDFKIDAWNAMVNDLDMALLNQELDDL